LDWCCLLCCQRHRCCRYLCLLLPATLPLQGQDFSGQNLQRSNFTSADCRDCNFSKSQLQVRGEASQRGLG
jgi:uncharacterized protein YjbI with pentapeptide repeats